MAEKYQQMYPLSVANGVPRSDEESTALQSNELRKKKRMKCIAYIAIFAVFQTAIILLFALTVMRVKTPKVRFGTVTVDNIITNSSSAPPSFSMRLTAQVNVKNTNFGRYKFDDSLATVMHDGVDVGQFIIPERRASARSTEKIQIMVDLKSSGLSNSSRLSSEIDSGVLMLSSQAELRGKVELMKVIKKKKTAEMSCTMAINLTSNQVQDLNCK